MNLPDPSGDDDGIAPGIECRAHPLVTAVDNAGNSTTDKYTYDVTYAWSGFSGAIDGPPTINTGKAGRTFSLRFPLEDASGSPITDVAAVASIRYRSVSCSWLTGTGDAIEASSTGGTSLPYDSASEMFVYNWKSPGAGCYELIVTLSDGTARSVNFKLS